MYAIYTWPSEQFLLDCAAYYCKLLVNRVINIDLAFINEIKIYLSKLIFIGEDN